MKRRLTATAAMAIALAAAVPNQSGLHAADIAADRVDTRDVRTWRIGSSSGVSLNADAEVSGVMSVSGGAAFQGGMCLVAPLGDVPMGPFTNTAETAAPQPGAPGWWAEYGVTTSDPVDDFAAATQGQVKWIASRARVMLDDSAAPEGGAGPAVDALVDGFGGGPDFVPATLGQLKNTAEPFWMRLVELSAAGGLPWGGPATNDFALANIGQVKNLFSFDLSADTDGDGMPDWWESHHGLDPLDPADALLDHDGDGLTNLREYEHGTGPSNADSDGDLIPDGIELMYGTDPTKWDTDDDGLNDMAEIGWSGTDPLNPDTDGDGVSDGDEIFWGRDPNLFNHPSEWEPHTNKINLVATKIFSSYDIPDWAIAVPPSEVIYSRKFEIDRQNGWTQYYLSARPDGAGGWDHEGLAVYWIDSGGQSGAVSDSATDSLHLPLSSTAHSVTIEIRQTDLNMRAPTPLYLLEWSPIVDVSSSGAHKAIVDGVECTAFAGNGVPIYVDVSLDVANRPKDAPVSAEEMPGVGAPFPGDPSLVFEPNPAPHGTPVIGGRIKADAPGVYEMPEVKIPRSPAAPMSQAGAIQPLSAPGGAGGADLLLLLTPMIMFDVWSHSGCSPNLNFDPETAIYSPVYEYPVDSGCLRRNWYRDVSGGSVCTCSPWIEYGNESLESWFSHEVELKEGGQVVGKVFFEGAEIWNGSTYHFLGESCVERGVELLSGTDECGGCSTGCADGNCDGLEGGGLGSVEFRIPLGMPRDEQVSGFVWFRAEYPVVVTRDLFYIESRSDALVSDATSGDVRTVVCSDGRGRTIEIADIENGVLLTVTKTVGGELEHTWEITNTGGASSRIRMRKISRANNVMSDVEYFLHGGSWTAHDYLSGFTSQIAQENTLNQNSGGMLREERVVKDATNGVVSSSITISERVGSGNNAVLREVYQAERGYDGELIEDFASYWVDSIHHNRNGRPKMVWGDSRGWSFQAWDDAGREVLRLDQLDGSLVPFEVTNSIVMDVEHMAAYGVTAIATESDYTPHSGDSGRWEDAGKARTEVRYMIRHGVATVLGRTWYLYKSGADSHGWPTLSTTTIRACSQTAAIDDPGNSVSVNTYYDGDAPGVSLVLRGRPVESRGDDGSVISCSYAQGDYDAATRIFSERAGGNAIRTIESRSSVSAPDGIPEKSTQSMTITDATHGTTLYSATLLRSTGETLEWRANSYDDKNRLRSTVYSDGSSTTNAYSCCRLLWRLDREGMKTERLAQTGTDHLRYAMLEVSLPELPQNEWYETSYHYAEPGAYPYARTYSFKATEYVFDALGRQTRVRELATEPERASDITTLRKSNSGWESVETTEYPYGASDFQIRTDARGIVAKTARSQSPGETVMTTETFDGSTLLTCETSRDIRGGGSMTRWESGGEWTETENKSRYTDDGRRIELSVTTTSDGGTVTNSVAEYDFLGRSRIYETPLSRTVFQYDGASSRVVSETDTLSWRVRTPLYDELGDPVGEVMDGVTSLSVSTYEYISNAWWRVQTSFRTADGVTNGLAVHRTRLTGLSNALRSQTETVSNGRTVRTVASFDPQSKVTTVTTTCEGMAPVISKSKFGREIQRTGADGVTHYNFFDPYGRVYLTRENNGQRYYWRSWILRNSFGDVFAEARIIGGSWANTARFYEYDRMGNATNFQNEAGDATYWQYDSQSRLSGQSGAVYPARFGYDALSRLVSMSTTRDGETWDETQWTFDSATGLNTAKIYADGSEVFYTYTPEGLPLRTTWSRGKWRQNSYDARQRLSAVAYSSADTPGYEITLDDFGRPVTVADDAGNVHRYAYDGNSMLTNETAVTVSATAVLERGVDQCGRPASTSLSINGAFKGRAVYSYDGYDRISGIAFTNGYGRGIRVSYTNFAGHSLGRTTTLPSGDVFSRSLTRDGYRSYRVTGSVEAFNGAEVSRFTYGHDNLDRLTLRNTDTFSYNKRSEIAAATILSNAYAYAYDSAGNQTTSTVDYAVTAYSANSLNQYTSILRASAPLREPSYDLDGNLLSDGVFTYIWDAENRLVGVSSNGVELASYTYDYLHRRIGKTTHYPLPTTHSYLYDGWNLIHETITSASGAVSEIHYHWGNDLSGTLQGAGGVGGLLAVSINGAYYLPCYDNNGNITAYVNEAGVVVAEYSYDAFGATTTQSGTMAEAFPHRFSTKYHDPETGLYYYGRRFYSPEQHRWLNRDPIEEEGGINLYAFCRNNPLKFIDPHGFSVWFAAGNITAYEKDILQELVDDHNLRVKKAKAYFDKFKLREASKKYTRIFKWNGNVVTSDVFFKRLDEETAILKSTSFKTLDGDMKEITELVNKHTYSYDQTVYTHETTIETYLSNDGSNAATEYRYIVEYSKEPETPIDTVAAAVKKIPIKKGTLVHNACFTDPEHKLKSSLNRKWANKGAENDKVHYGYKKLKGENNKCEIYFDTFEYYTVETTGDAPPIMGFETIE